MSGGRVDHKQTPSSLPRHKEFWVGSMAGANYLHSRVYGSINMMTTNLEAPKTIAVTAVINLPASGGRKEFVYGQPSLHSYLIL